MTISKIAAAVAIVAVLSIGAFAQIIPPQGRLTLQSGTPVMTEDVTGASTIYYTPYIGNSVPIYNGTSFTNYTFSQLTLTLGLGWAFHNNVFDVFIINNSGTVTLAAGYWEGGTISRGTGSYSPELTNLDGVLVNEYTLDLYNGDTTFGSYPANEATYLGSFYTPESYVTSVNPKPAAAAGGTNNLIGIWNGYNRVPIESLVSDSDTAWTYSSSSFCPLDGGSGCDSNYNFRVTYLDGLQQSFVSARVTTIAYASEAGAGASIGVYEDGEAIGDTPTVRGTQESAAAGNAVGAVNFAAEENFPPQLGLHYLQAMQSSLNGYPVTFGFNGGSTFLLYRGEY